MNTPKVTLWLNTIGVLVTLGCTIQNDCEIDIAFKKYFDNSIRIAEIRSGYDTLNQYLDVATIYRAIKSLETVTGEPSTVIWSCDAFGFYPSPEHFEIDRRRWQSWYRQNRCTMSMDLAQQKFEAAREPLPNYDDPNVLQRIKDKFEEEERDSARYLDSTTHIQYQIDWPAILISSLSQPLN